MSTVTAKPATQLLPPDEQRQCIFALLGTFKRLLQNDRPGEAFTVLESALTFAVWWHYGVLADKRSMSLIKVAQTLRSNHQISAGKFNRIKKAANSLAHHATMSPQQIDKIYRFVRELVPAEQEVAS